MDITGNATIALRILAEKESSRLQVLQATQEVQAATELLIAAANQHNMELSTQEAEAIFHFLRTHPNLEQWMATTPEADAERNNDS